MMERLKVALILWLAMLPNYAHAWPPTYGSEFNFENKWTRSAWNSRLAKSAGDGRWQDPDEVEQAWATKFSEAVKKRCGIYCTVEPIPGKFGSTEYQVKLDNGYSFKISVDPACVEIITAPETLAQLKKNEIVAQKLIFDVARDLGFEENMSGRFAHFNVGILSAFDKDPKGFLRFFANFHNIPELSTGALGENFHNAPPLSHLRSSQRKAFSKIVNGVNTGRLAMTPQDLAVWIQKKVYTHTPTAGVGKHYQGISVKYVTSGTTLEEDRPFELRSPRQPKNAHERTLLAELIESRIAFEKAQEDPIIFLDLPKSKFYWPSDIANKFRFYVMEMGADWNHFEELLPEGLRGFDADPFLAAKIDWQDAKHLNNLEEYIPYLPNSAWVRTRMREILSSPEALASDALPRLKQIAYKSLGRNASKEARAIIKEFFGSLDLPKGDNCSSWFSRIFRPRSR